MDGDQLQPRTRGDTEVGMVNIGLGSCGLLMQPGMVHVVCNDIKTFIPTRFIWHVVFIIPNIVYLVIIGFLNN